MMDLSIVKPWLLSCLLALGLPACDQTAGTVDGLVASPSLEGKWLFINYWALWCQPCREEIPELNAFAAENADSVIVYGVNYDAAPAAEQWAQARELGIAFPRLATDPAPELNYARPTVLPTTVVIGPAGEVWARLLGPQTSESLHAAMIAPAQKLSPPVE